MTVTAKTIGARLREARESRGLRPEAVAAELDVSRDTIDRFEAGASNPSALQVWKVAVLTGYPFSWFATTSGEPIPEELDRALLAHLLNDLDAYERHRSEAIAKIRALIGH